MLFSKIHPKHPHLGLIIPCLASEIANKNDCLMEWLNKLILLVGGLERGFYFSHILGIIIPRGVAQPPTRLGLY
jgi:hypothetical protein